MTKLRLFHIQLDFNEENLCDVDHRSRMNRMNLNNLKYDKTGGAQAQRNQRVYKSSNCILAMNNGHISHISGNQWLANAML